MSHRIIFNDHLWLLRWPSLFAECRKPTEPKPDSENWKKCLKNLSNWPQRDAIYGTLIHFHDLHRLPIKKLYFLNDVPEPMPRLFPSLPIQNGYVHQRRFWGCQVAMPVQDVVSSDPALAGSTPSAAWDRRWSTICKISPMWRLKVDNQRSLTYSETLFKLTIFTVTNDYLAH